MSMHMRAALVVGVHIGSHLLEGPPSSWPIDPKLLATILEAHQRLYRCPLEGADDLEGLRILERVAFFGGLSADAGGYVLGDAVAIIDDDDEPGIDLLSVEYHEARVREDLATISPALALATPCLYLVRGYI